MSCRKFLVAGRVQGVFFRASTRSRALELGLTGHAINLPDGRVEVLACGDEDSLAKLERWLWEGPLGADVTVVESEEADAAAPAGFATG